MKNINKETSSNSKSAHLGISDVSGSRKIDKTLAMVMGIKATIEQSSKHGVAGYKDLLPILDRLKSLGVDAKAEPTTLI